MIFDRLLALTTQELARKQDLFLLMSRSAEERIIGFLVDLVLRTSPRESDVVDLPMTRGDIADFLGLTVETVYRVLWGFERLRPIKISSNHSIVLRNHSADGRGKSLAELFEGVKGRRPNTQGELKEWCASLEGKAATLFKLTSLSRWGDRARS